jgi:hypothetical protein
MALAEDVNASVDSVHVHIPTYPITLSVCFVILLIVVTLSKLRPELSNEKLPLAYAIFIDCLELINVISA